MNIFSFKGRSRRRVYWSVSLVIGLVGKVLETLVEASPDDSGMLVFYAVLCVPILWVAVATCTRRCHDLGHNGFWQLIPFYSLWMAFKSGNTGPNKYGEDPKAGEE